MLQKLLVVAAMAGLSTFGQATRVTAQDKPLILRGTVVATAVPQPEPPPRRDVRLVAGDVLWIVDEDGKVTACRLRSTAQTDGERVVCRSRRID